MLLVPVRNSAPFEVELPQNDVNWTSENIEGLDYHEIKPKLINVITAQSPMVPRKKRFIKGTSSSLYHPNTEYTQIMLQHHEVVSQTQLDLRSTAKTPVPKDKSRKPPPP
jgi:hypothetical protein